MPAHHGRIKGPAPAATMTRKQMVATVGRVTEYGAMQKSVTLMVPLSKDSVGGGVTITNLDAWRWNRWNCRWEMQGQAQHIE